MFVVDSRTKAGLTQRTLAERLGVRQSMVTRIELGQRSIEIGEFVSICRIVGEDPAISLAKLLDTTLPEHSTPTQTED